MNGKRENERIEYVMKVRKTNEVERDNCDPRLGICWGKGINYNMQVAQWVRVNVPLHHQHAAYIVLLFLSMFKLK